MKKRVVSILLVLTMSAGLICGCSKQENNSAAESTSDTGAAAEEVSMAGAEGSQQAQQTAEDSGVDVGASTSTAGGLFLGDSEVIYYNKELVPSVEPYTVAKDMANVTIPDRFSYFFDDEYGDSGIKLRDALVKNNGFAIKEPYGDSEFFDLYEDNRYMQFPSFVTVDSLMHTYHLYFAYLMRHAEKDYIAEKLKDLTSKMMEASTNQFKALEGTDWGDAALRNMEFFYIGGSLQGISVSTPINSIEFDETIKGELSKIEAAEGVDTCALSGRYQDYSQFKVRGYYEGDEELEKYFRSMMWYGQIPYALDTEDTVKSAVLMSLAIAEAGKENWENIYNVTSFFAGRSDDPGYAELMPIIREAYGKVPDAKELSADSASFEKLTKALASLSKPAINSIPVDEGENPVIPSFRFMGQRFSVDAAIMQRLVYSAVEENADGDRRYLPDALDTAAGLGSEMALEILDGQGATGFKNYNENLSEVKQLFSGADPATWNASLYSGWLNTLRPLLETKGTGYPSFMQSDEWTKKNLETFAGSYAELKHDTILYAKQVMAEMGGGDDEEIIDDRGYVEPEPVVYSRFAFLSEKTKEGLTACGMLSDEAAEDLDKLSTMAKTLLDISEKELTNQDRTDEEYDFIREYGGYLEHFWMTANKEKYDGLVYSYQAPCPVVADIATDPNGAVLEVGTGKAQTMYVVFPIDDELHVGRGSVYTFYQFVTPISDRLTDEEWRNRLEGGYLDDNWEWVENTNKPVQPEWTQSYRVGD